MWRGCPRCAKGCRPTSGSSASTTSPPRRGTTSTRTLSSQNTFKGTSPFEAVFRRREHFLFPRHITLKEGPPILNGKNPTDLPNYDLGRYETGSESIVGCYSGPNGGLTTVRRVEKHLSVTDADIDFIDTPHEERKYYRFVHNSTLTSDVVNARTFPHSASSEISRETLG